MEQAELLIDLLKEHAQRNQSFDLLPNEIHTLVNYVERMRAKLKAKTGGEIKFNTSEIIV